MTDQFDTSDTSKAPEPAAVVPPPAIPEFGINYGDALLSLERKTKLILAAMLADPLYDSQEKAQVQEGRTEILSGFAKALEVAIPDKGKEESPKAAPKKKAATKKKPKAS